MKKKVLIIMGLVILLVGVFVGVYFLVNKNNEASKDAIKFKEEYEAYNDKINENNNKKYLNLAIDKKNPIVYKSAEDIIDVMKEESALIYFGWATCPWCRNTIEPLLEAAKEQNLKTIYYVDIYDIRDSYVYEKKKVKQTKKGTDAYYEILEILGDNLSKYYVKDSKGKNHDTKVTRLYGPTLVAIHKGEVVAIHEGTLDTHKDPYVALSNNDKKELTKIIAKMIKDLKNKSEVCSREDAC